MKKNVETFIGCDSEYDESSIVIYGAPFDATTSFRPGTRFASKVMRSESFGLETYSPYLGRDLTDYHFFDAGDLELPFANVDKALKMIEDQASEILNDGKIPCMIGGEHLVTLGQFRAIYKKYPNVRVIHFDAHADLRQEYLDETLSHATVIRRVYDLVGDNRIYQFGIRSGDRSEFEFSKEHTIMNKFNFNGLKEVTELLKNDPVYFTLDLDVLDPSIFPGTGTPEAGGVTFNELNEALGLLKGLNIVGFDINELSPVYDQSGGSTAVACKVLRELLLIIGGK
ncbi:MAG: agmatinase [Erysipelotrichaceae bacterium]|nr:agmatinase [Erysipelotrichaceae bacterium]